MRAAVHGEGLGGKLDLEAPNGGILSEVIKFKGTKLLPQGKSSLLT
jgi:hypothetical protein